MPLVSRNVRDADPEQPISNERTLEEIVQANIAPRCVQVRIIAAFAALELLPAGIGLHGLRNLGFGPPRFVEICYGRKLNPDQHCRHARWASRSSANLSFSMTALKKQFQ